MITLKRLGLIPIFVLYMIFPLTYSIGKWGLHYGPYSLYIALRMLFAGSVIAAWYFLFNRSSMVIKKNDIHYFVAIGAIAFCASFMAEFWALPYLPIAKMSLYFALSPFFTALFAVFHKLEIISPRKLLGLFVGFCGFAPQLFINNETGYGCSVLSFSYYDLAALFSVAAYAYGWILIKKLSKRTMYEGGWVNSVCMLIGGFLSLIYSIVIDLGQTGSFNVTNWYQFLLSAVLISAVGVFCYLLYTALLRYFTATLISFFCFLEVPSALLLGFFFLGENVSYIFFVSTALIVIGLYLFYQEELRLR